ncbi:MAG: hypothetical protein ACLT3W_04920 [Bifidobacterium pseudocatenulatum]
MKSAPSKAADAGQVQLDRAIAVRCRAIQVLQGRQKTTLDEAIEMADNWVNQQAAKAQ